MMPDAKAWRRALLDRTLATLPVCGGGRAQPGGAAYDAEGVARSSAPSGPRSRPPGVSGPPPPDPPPVHLAALAGGFTFYGVILGDPVEALADVLAEIEPGRRLVWHGATLELVDEGLAARWPDGQVTGVAELAQAAMLSVAGCMGSA